MFVSAHLLNFVVQTMCQNGILQFLSYTNTESPMKKYLCIILLAYCTTFMAVSADDGVASGRFFPYPTVPDRITTLHERCNYLITHFWDRCNFKNAFSSYPKMNAAVGDFLSFMPYATADTAHMAIDELIAKVKKNPKHTLALANMAKGYLMSDTAEYVSEELYLPFAQAVADNKKIPAADREPFAREARIIANTQIGARVSDMTLEHPDGTTSTLSAHSAPMMLLVFTLDTDNGSNMARLRLSADYALNKMIADQRLHIINIHTAADNDKWQSWAAGAPENWVTVRCDEAKELYDLSVLPEIVYINRKFKVLGKNFSVDDIINSFQNHVMTH